MSRGASRARKAGLEHPIQTATTISIRKSAGSRRLARLYQKATKSIAPVRACLAQQQAGDEVARQDEEDVDAEEPAADPAVAKVIGDDGQDRGPLGCRRERGDSRLDESREGATWAARVAWPAHLWARLASTGRSYAAGDFP